MKIALTSVFVDDQSAAEKFYTETLGWQVHRKVPLGQDFWLTVVSSEDPNGPELLLEPSSHPAVRPFREALVADGIPFAQFAVADLQAEFERLSELGVRFTQPPMDVGPATMAVFDDTCGNLIQLVQPKVAP